MTYTIKITDQADNDIRNIYEYIAYELQSPEKASGQLDRIEKCIMSLDRSVRQQMMRSIRQQRSVSGMIS